MSQNTRRNSLLFLAAALVSLVLLAGSLSNLQLQAGKPFPGGGNSGNEPQLITDLASTDSYSSPLSKGILDLVLLTFIVYVSVRLIALINIKRFLQLLLIMIGLLMLANLLSNLPASRPVLPSGPSSEIEKPSFDYPISPLGQPPQTLIRLVSIGFVVGAILLAIRILKQRESPTRLEDQLSQEAESAVGAIQAGESLGNVIVRCYLQMTWALQEEQGIKRNEDMTVREFEDLLALKGFPTGPVRQLSGLFEKVRYGRQEVMGTDEHMAIESLNKIILFCRSKRNSGQ